MERQKKTDSGITLVALVVSIIVMLVLAGVSLNATVGENGILKQARNATLMSRFAGYKEEFEMNKIGAMIDQGFEEEFLVNLKGTDDEFLRWIPSVREEDRKNLEIISGFLVFIGDDLDEISAAEAAGVYGELNAELYDVIGKEFSYYVQNWLNSYNTFSVSRKNYFDNKDNVNIEEFREYAKIPNVYTSNDFRMDNSNLVYLGTNEDRLMALSSSANIRSYIVEGKLILANYVLPDEGQLSTDTDGNYVINDWIIKEVSTNGAISEGIIIGYKGNEKTVTIPDTLTGLDSSGRVSKTFKISKIQGDGTNNIFKTEDSSKVNTVKIIVAKGISSVTKSGLANLGANVQVHFLHVGTDLILGEDRSNTNVIGYEGIRNSCGSFVFVVSDPGNYTFKLWGASSGGYDTRKNTGLGGYSQGTVSLFAGDKVFCYIGGKGLLSVESVDFEDGSKGYNGGGSGFTGTTARTYGGGGATDIRYNNSLATETSDYRILIAGGGGGNDDDLNIPTYVNDGIGGSGGGTVYGLDTNGNIDKSLWSGYNGFTLGTSVATSTVTDDSIAKGAKWVLNGTTYTPTGFSFFYGGSGGYNQTGNSGDMGGAGGGYYGGFGSNNNNGGAGGGSAYADIDGKIRLVSNIAGYSGYDEKGYGEEMKANYGNGKIIISKN